MPHKKAIKKLMKEESMFRTLLKNEVTWVVMIIAAVLGVVRTVIIPLNNMQIQLTQIQLDIAQSKSDFRLSEIERQSNKSRIDVLETQVNSLMKLQK